VASWAPSEALLTALCVSQKADVLIPHYPYLIQTMHEQHYLCCLVYLPWLDSPTGPRLYEDFARYTPGY